MQAASYLNACLLHCYFNQVRKNRWIFFKVLMSKTVWDWGVKSAENLVDILKNNIVTGSLVMLKIYKGLSAVI